MPWNSNLWNSKAEKEKFPEQKNTHWPVNYYKKTDSELRISIAKSIEIVFSHSVKIRMVG